MSQRTVALSGNSSASGLSATAYVGSFDELDRSSCSEDALEGGRLRRRWNGLRRREKKKVRQWLFQSMDDVKVHHQRFEQRQFDDLRRKLELQQEQLDRLQGQLEMLQAMMPELDFAFGSFAITAGAIQSWLRDYQKQ